MVHQATNGPLVHQRLDLPDAARVIWHVVPGSPPQMVRYRLRGELGQQSLEQDDPQDPGAYRPTGFTWIYLREADAGPPIEFTFPHRGVFVHVKQRVPAFSEPEDDVEPLWLWSVDEVGGEWTLPISGEDTAESVRAQIRTELARMA